MKINYTMWTPGLSGGIRVILEFAKGLARKGHTVTITALSSPTQRFPPEIDIITPSYRTVPASIYRSMIDVMSKIPLPPAFYGYAAGGLKKVGIPLGQQAEPSADNINLLSSSAPDCDVNVATFCFTAFSVLETRKGTPFYHIQHYEPLFFESNSLQTMAEQTYRLPLHQISNSTWLRSQLREKFGTDPDLVHPGIDTGTFYPREVEKQKNVMRIVSLGKSARWKGLPELFEALKIVRKSIPNLELIMYGSEPSIAAPIPGKYILRPSDGELARLYSSADLVVTPSWYESFPLPPLEAMACGAPVVTTRYGTEDYAVDGSNALVIPPRDVSQLSSAIQRVLTDGSLRARLGKEGPDTARRFTWERAIGAMEDLFMTASQGA